MINQMTKGLWLESAVPKQPPSSDVFMSCLFPGK